MINIFKSYLEYQNKTKEHVEKKYLKNLSLYHSGGFGGGRIITRVELEGKARFNHEVLSIE